MAWKHGNMENNTHTQRTEMGKVTFDFIKVVLSNTSKLVVFLRFIKYERMIVKILLLSFSQWLFLNLSILSFACYTPRLRQHCSNTFQVILSIAKVEESRACQDNLIL